MRRWPIYVEIYYRDIIKRAVKQIILAVNI